MIGGDPALPGVKDVGRAAGDCRPRDPSQAEASWRWLLAHTAHDTYPNDGYEKVNGASTKKPPENPVWLMAWTLEASLEGGRHFDR